MAVVALLMIPALVEAVLFILAAVAGIAFLFWELILSSMERIVALYRGKREQLTDDSTPEE